MIPSFRIWSQMIYQAPTNPVLSASPPPPPGLEIPAHPPSVHSDLVFPPPSSPRRTPTVKNQVPKHPRLEEDQIEQDQHGRVFDQGVRETGTAVLFSV